VGTVTLICAVLEIGVNTSAGVRVTVGSSVGSCTRDVGVAVAVSTTPTEMPEAVCVAPETMVPMTAVSREWMSCVGMGPLGRTQARERINKTLTDKRMGVDVLIFASFRYKAIINPKGGGVRHLRDVQ
jgi:hypothetical protein